MPKNSTSRELLGEMYRNVTMGSENLASVVSKISEKAMLTGVTTQLEGYADFTKRTEQLMQEQSMTPKKPSKMKKLMARSGIMMGTMFDSSDGHIADMIIKGTQMGADELEVSLITLDSADQAAKSLCREIVDFERSQAEKMREFT